jgi:hypothetical protein
VRLVMARLLSAQNEHPTSRTLRFLRAFNITCSTKDSRMMAFVVKKEVLATATWRRMQKWLSGHQWVLSRSSVTLELTIDYVYILRLPGLMPS